MSVVKICVLIFIISLTSIKLECYSQVRIQVSSNEINNECWNFDCNKIIEKYFDKKEKLLAKKNKDSVFVLVAKALLLDSGRCNGFLFYRVNNYKNTLVPIHGLKLYHSIVKVKTKYIYSGKHYFFNWVKIIIHRRKIKKLFGKDNYKIIKRKFLECPVLVSDN